MKVFGFSIISLSLIMSLMILPLKTSAGSLPGTLPFGGQVSYSVPCTCPGSIGSLWIAFNILYLGSDTPVTGSLVYVPYISQLFAWFSIGVPTAWHLGTYLPGVQMCWMLIPPPGTGCVPLPSAGVITQVGTSKVF